MNTDYESLIERITSLEAKMEASINGDIAFIEHLESRCDKYRQWAEKYSYDPTKHEDDIKAYFKSDDGRQWMQYEAAADVFSEMAEEYMRGKLTPASTIKYFSKFDKMDKVIGLPQKWNDKVDYLFITKVYDGPLAGFMKYEGEIFYFDCIHGSEIYEISFRPRVFVAYRLTEEQLKYEMEWHDLFSKYVSTQRDYRVPEAERGLRPYEEHHKFYDAAKDRKPLDLTKATPVFWYWR